MSAQRYSSPLAHTRMSEGNCPECGSIPQAHGNDPRFWMPSNVSCGLLEWGVNERIAQFRVDQKSVEVTRL